jgi:hypothetical protein
MATSTRVTMGILFAIAAIIAAFFEPAPPQPLLQKASSPSAAPPSVVEQTDFGLN